MLTATLPLDARCQLDPGKTASTLTCKLQIPNRHLSFLPTDDQVRAEIECAVVEKISTDRYQMQHSRFSIRLTAGQTGELETKATVYTGKWPISTDVTTVRLIVRDRLSSNYATLDLPVESIPPTRTGTDEPPAAPLPPDADPFIGKAREATLSFLKELPNYVVREHTNREVQGRINGMWTVNDRISAEVVFESGKETIRDVTLNGLPTTVRQLEETGTWSTGQFAGTLKGIFDPESKAVFRERGTAKVGGRDALVYDYSIERANSGWKLSSVGETYITAYRGTVWLDRETARTLRFDMKAHAIPQSFRLDRAESSTVFGPVRIGEKTYLMPENSTALACSRVSGAGFGMRNRPAVSQACTRNVIQFSDYKQFGVESNITFTPGHE
jgi:hypothetical protein